MRQQKAQRPDDVRRGGKQHLAFPQRFGDEPELILLQIAQTAVDQLGAGRRGMRGEIVFLA